MIKNFDGCYLNETHIGAIIPELRATTARDYYQIKFIVYSENYYGITEYRTEKECRQAIERLFNANN